MRTRDSRGTSGGGNIRQRPDGRWEGRYTAGIDPGTGKQIQKSIYGKTQKEVRERLRKITSEIDEGSYLEPSKCRVGKWLDIWLNEYTENVKPYTKYSYQVTIKNHLKPAFGYVRLAELNTVMVQAFLNNLVRSKAEGGKGLSPKTAINIHGVFHRALKQAVNIGLIRSNPTDACIRPRGERKPIRPLEDEEVGAFLRAIEGHRFALLYLVDLFTGMRQGEILGLTWDCVDFRRGTIFLYRQLQQRQAKGDFGYYFTSLKNGKSRTITPAPTVMRVLQAQRKAQNEMRLRAGAAWHNDEELVFTDELGRPLSRRTVYKNFKQIANQLDLPNLRFHDLRHTFATISFQSGDDPKTVQENLGHHSAAFTLDVYGHVTDRMKRESAERMERFIHSTIAR